MQLKQKEQKKILTLKEIQEIELQVLLRFKDICEKYNLRYSLAYGTLLGAIRHKGFIPWDDDIDVMMPRPDYLKFVAVFDEECKNEKYGLVSMHNSHEYFAPLAKMFDDSTQVIQQYGQIEKTPYGVYIDIFIVDGLPLEREELLYKRAEKIRFKWGMANRKLFKRKSRNFLTFCGGVALSLIYKMHGYIKYRDEYDALASSTDFETSDSVAVIIYGEGLKKEKMSVAEFEDLSEVEFEGHLFKTVRTPRDYLDKMYGDYMKLPPIENQVSKHSSYAIRK